jgi:hypothetical protein
MKRWTRSHHHNHRHNNLWMNNSTHSQC